MSGCPAEIECVSRLNSGRHTLFCCLNFEQDIIFLIGKQAIFLHLGKFVAHSAAVDIKIIR